jgi:hypothetical protein
MKLWTISPLSRSNDTGLIKIAYSFNSKMRFRVTLDAN